MTNNLPFSVASTWEDEGLGSRLQKTGLARKDDNSEI